MGMPSRARHSSRQVMASWISSGGEVEVALEAVGGGHVRAGARPGAELLHQPARLGEVAAHELAAGPGQPHLEGQLGVRLPGISGNEREGRR